MNRAEKRLCPKLIIREEHPVSCRKQKDRRPTCEQKDNEESSSSSSSEDEFIDEQKVDSSIVDRDMMGLDDSDSDSMIDGENNNNPEIPAEVDENLSIDSDSDEFGGSIEGNSGLCRSTRINAGKHNNIFHEPRSVLLEELQFPFPKETCV